MKRILITGGSGNLGRALQELIPELIAPPRAELDITNPHSIERALIKYQPDVVVHAAAFTDEALAATNPELCWETNVSGTRNIVEALWNTKLVHISTDRVFAGGEEFKEDDTVGPAKTHHALSKLVAEEVVRSAADHLIIRTGFYPNLWAPALVPSDCYTSRDYLDVITRQIAMALYHLETIPFDTLHIATERKSYFELARRRHPEVKQATYADTPSAFKEEWTCSLSLATERWRQLKVNLVGDQLWESASPLVW